MEKRPWHQPIAIWFQIHNRLWVEGEPDDLYEPLSTDGNEAWIQLEQERLRRLRLQQRERNCHPLKSDTRLRLVKEKIRSDEEADVWMISEHRMFYEIHGETYEEEEAICWKFNVRFSKGKWGIADGRLAEPSEWKERTRVTTISEQEEPAGTQQGYNRARAVQYAEIWWNSYNPRYRRFEVDCTSFVSQCMVAGGIPMNFTSRRDRGWWYRGPHEQWSYSWAVADSLKRYLSTGGTPRAVMVDRPDQLSLGDIICYDWEGSGRYDHNTIVTAFDTNGMPLVNAHTVNSRHRYWEYRDSHAWTPRVQYRFFHIQG